MNNNELNQAATAPVAAGPRYRWWHGAAFLIGVTALTRWSKPQREADIAFYETQKSPVWSPPGVAFPLVWPVNNLALSWGGLRLLNAPATLPHRRTLLALQGVLWLDFATFGAAYFQRRSPILLAVWTLADAGTAVASWVLARRTGDPKLPFAYLPVTAWTCYGSTTAVYQALRNPDAYFGTAASLEEAPVPLLEKAAD